MRLGEDLPSHGEEVIQGVEELLLARSEGSCEACELTSRGDMNRRFIAPCETAVTTRSSFDEVLYFL